MLQFSNNPSPRTGDRNRRAARGQKASLTIRSISVSWVEIVGMAIAALWSNKLRSTLTMLGIIIGITAVIAVTSIGQGVQKATADNLQGLGADVVQVFAGAASAGNVRQGTGSATTLTWDDAEAIAAQIPDAAAVAAYLQQTAQVVYEQENISTPIIGTDIFYPTVNNVEFELGRFFTAEEIESAQAVAVLGPDVRDDLFDQRDTAIGKRIRIQGESYTVIGVTEAKGSQGRFNPDEQVYVPLTNMSARLVGNNALTGIAVQGIAVKVSDQDQLDAVMYQITNLLRVRHGIYPSDGDEDDFQLMNAADIVDTLNSTLSLFTVMVVAIAGISLIVGGIGIANIMLVSVVERTREIGVRKAIGATQSAILKQFLTEAVVIALLGGITGIVLGVAIALIAAIAFGFPFILSGWAVALGFGLSVLIGLFAGVIPAQGAARLDPITALRSD